jgi:hypothetical protein
MRGRSVSLVLHSVHQIARRAEEGEGGREIRNLRGQGKGIPQLGKLGIASGAQERLPLEASPASRTGRREKETRESSPDR